MVALINYKLILLVFLSSGAGTGKPQFTCFNQFVLCVCVCGGSVLYISFFVLSND